MSATWKTAVMDGSARKNIAQQMTAIVTSMGQSLLQLVDQRSGRCGTVNPDDPRQGCCRSQPVSIEDYYRANTKTVLMPEDELAFEMPI
jgi:hypothetical protein